MTTFTLTDLEVSILLQVADGERPDPPRRTASEDDTSDEDWNFATRTLFQNNLVKHSFTGWQLTNTGRAEAERRRPIKFQPSALYEVEFDCFSYSDSGQFTVRHNVCEGVSLSFETLRSRSTFSLDDEDLDALISALQEAKRRRMEAR